MAVVGADRNQLRARGWEVEVEGNMDRAAVEQWGVAEYR